MHSADKIEQTLFKSRTSHFISFIIIQEEPMFKHIFVSLLLILACASSAIAQTAQEVITPAGPPAASDETMRSLELNTGVQNLSGGYGNWREVTLRGTYGMPSHLLQAELSAQRRFNEDGVYIGFSDTYTFNEDWYGFLGVGAGDGAFFLPRYRVDAALYRKLLPNRNLVVNVGAGYYKAPDIYNDRNISLGASYYFGAPLVLEGGVRMNISNPGSVRTQQQFAALTYGRDKQDIVSARYAWGSEGYLAVGPSTQMVNFESREVNVSWRHWFNPRTGVLVSANRYDNPLYHRTGVNVGIFHSF